MESLEVRRKSLCVSFAKKSQKHEKFQNWFQESDQLTPTTFQPVPYRTKRYKNSPLPHLTSLLNDAIWWYSSIHTVLLVDNSGRSWIIVSYLWMLLTALVNWILFLLFLNKWKYWDKELGVIVNRVRKYLSTSVIRVQSLCLINRLSYLGPGSCRKEDCSRAVGGG